jgi:hypothetical protein
MTHDELVEKMVHAGWREYCPVAPDLHGDVWKAWIAGMDAALSAAVEEIVSHLHNGKVMVDSRHIENLHYQGSVSNDCEFNRGWLTAKDHVAAYLKPKSAEDRVTIETDALSPVTIYWTCKDGKRVSCFAEWELAAALKIGLIQQLKEAGTR